jgi:molybdopterin/thiamine biosynthesis adenylyltransferase
VSASFSARLDKLNREAIAEAESALAEQGFQQSDNVWQGNLDLGQHGFIPITVQLSSRFPDALPDIFIEPKTLPHSIPHIERSGRICLAPSTGILLDTSQPSGLVVEALQLATNTLIKGLSGANVDDISDEFEAYWIDENTSQVWSICDLTGPARPISCFWLRPPDRMQTINRLFANSREAARTWAHRVGWRVKRAVPGFLIPLTTTFLPPSPNRPITFVDVQQIMQQHASPETAETLTMWLEGVTFPITLLVVLPLRGAQSIATVGIDVEVPQGAAARQLQRGFRPGKMTAMHTLRLQPNLPVKRLLIERLDTAYVVPRGGADVSLSTYTIAVVGCGAVGSHIVSHLAALGVGKLRLVDPEHLTSANIHRHVLGVSYLRWNKARGMAFEIGCRFPHLDVEYRERAIEEVLREEAAFITEADLVVIAIGDPTVELRINELLDCQKPRLHAWVEPLGIGGHILATGITEGLGCYRCLYKEDEIFGLINLASFAEPGQTFQRTMGGCAGQFVPFAALDADRIAGEAARLAAQILTGMEREHVLISIREDEHAFCDAGYKLAPRARLIAAGSRYREKRHIRNDCPTCGRWGH